MKRAQAIRLALECIEREIKRIAVEANMHDMAGATYPAAVEASVRRTELRQAITTLKEPEQQRMKL